MKVVSQIDLNETVRELCANELGFLLLQADCDNMYDLLAQKTTYQDRQGMSGDDKMITYHLFPVYYQKSELKSVHELIEIRANAIRNIFARWTKAGYNKRRAKDPYNCKAFIQYLDDIEYMKADYMLLLVD